MFLALAYARADTVDVSGVPTVVTSASKVSLRREFLSSLCQAHGDCEHREHYASCASAFNCRFRTPAGVRRLVNLPAVPVCCSCALKLPLLSLLISPSCSPRVSSRLTRRGIYLPGR